MERSIAGNRRTTVKDRKKEIGKGMLNKMLADLGIDRDDSSGSHAMGMVVYREDDLMPDTYNYPAEVEHDPFVRAAG